MLNHSQNGRQTCSTFDGFDVEIVHLQFQSISLFPEEIILFLFLCLKEIKTFLLFCWKYPFLLLTFPMCTKDFAIVLSLLLSCIHQKSQVSLRSENYPCMTSICYLSELWYDITCLLNNHQMTCKQALCIIQGWQALCIAISA